MSVDLRQALRLVLSLTNPSAIPGARWGEASVDTNQALRPVLSLPNPSELRPQEVPVGHGARGTGGENIFGKRQHRRASQEESASSTVKMLVFADLDDSVIGSSH